MRVLVREAFDQGAIGFTSSQLELHVAHDGRGVPSNHAAPEELIALASVLADVGRGSIEFIPRTFLTGYDDDDRARARARPRLRAPGAPEHAHDDAARPRRLAAQPRVRRRSRQRRLGAPPDVREQPPRRALLARVDVPVRRDAELPRHADVATGAARRALARSGDPQPDANRDRRPDRPLVRLRLAGAAASRPSPKPENEKWIGSSVTEIADATGADPLDAFLDLSLDEDLETQFVLAAPPDPKRRAATEKMIRSPFVMAGSSDGGAHLLSFCGADYTTRLLTEWVPDVLTLEQAVARLTSIPAHAVGMPERGVLTPGAPADLLVIDRDALADARRAALRARLPRRLRSLRRGRGGLPRGRRQRRDAARRRHVDRRDPGPGVARLSVKTS